MTVAQSGDTVAVHYVGTLADGSEFDRSQESQPISFTLGAGQVIPGFEEAIVGMEEGDEKTVTIAAGEAYGEHDPSRIHQVPREQIPPEINLQVGVRLQANHPSGGEVMLTVVGMDEQSVVLDENHPLAGRDLTFKLQLVSVQS